MRDMMLNALEEKRKRLRDEKDNENDIANGKEELGTGDLNMRCFLQYRLTELFTRYFLFYASNSKP
jgi:hypothetical protein